MLPISTRTSPLRTLANSSAFFTSVLVLLGWQVWRMQDQLTAAKAQEQQLRTQVQLQQQENDALQKSIDQGGSQEEMERIARDELGLVSPGERVFVDIGH